MVVPLFFFKEPNMMNREYRVQIAHSTTDGDTLIRNHRVTSSSLIGALTKALQQPVPFMVSGIRRATISAGRVVDR